MASSLEQAACVVTCQNVCKSDSMVTLEACHSRLLSGELAQETLTENAAGHRDEEAVLS